MATQPSPDTTDPTIELTSVPALGSYLHLKGVVKNADAPRVRVAVYIRVHGGWWNKPYWENPASAVQPDGSFSVDITTGGRDEEATDIAVFVIPEDYHPPGVRGEVELPSDVVEKALARADVARTT
jgi:hypothetical protein